ncbi:MAG: hypothetical protein KDE33_26945 [Bacteroidetes bacterium]|nr:hypothetical protein [Bacteroidota bacterium]
MDKAELMAIGTLIKVALGLVGITWTIVLLVGGLINKDNKRLKKGGLVFLGTWVILLVLGAIEFAIIAQY